MQRRIEPLLNKVEKPGRYIGGELHSVLKDPASAGTRFGFAFPDIYEIGMSFLGLQILYGVLNREEDIFCERIFAPADDMERLMREEGVPLFTLETKSPVRELDIVGFTLQYEMSFTNILNMLSLADIPFHAKQRGAGDPLIVAGGPCAFNPEPLADFIDVFMIGDGEDLIVELCRRHERWKASGASKEMLLKSLADLPGIYIPSFYSPVYREDGTLERLDKNWDEAPDVVEKAMIPRLEEAFFPEKTIVPFIEVVHDRSVVETFRGCTRGCRFCQAGMIYRPVRERSKEKLEHLARELLSSSGYEELSLLSLSTSDYSRFEELATELMNMCRENQVSLSLPSLRLDNFSFRVLQEIQRYKKSGLTFAPEAGSQRLRNVINKNITEEDIYGAVEQALELGWNSIKLYFMIGLPTETRADLDGIAEIARKILALNYALRGRRGGRFQVTVSVSNFVPKPHTPFQWFPQDSGAAFAEKHDYLRSQLKGIKGVVFHYHHAETSQIEAVLARGDRRASALLERAWALGCRFDGWSEHFKFPLWLQAFEDTGLSLEFYAGRERGYDERLPWDHIDPSVSREFLIRENKAALNEALTHDCRLGCVGCGVSRRIDCEPEGIHG